MKFVCLVHDDDDDDDEMKLKIGMSNMKVNVMKVVKLGLACMYK